MGSSRFDVVVAVLLAVSAVVWSALEVALVVTSVQNVLPGAASAVVFVLSLHLLNVSCALHVASALVFHESNRGEHVYHTLASAALAFPHAVRAIASAVVLAYTNLPYGSDFYNTYVAAIAFEALIVVFGGLAAFNALIKLLFVHFPDAKAAVFALIISVPGAALLFFGVVFSTVQLQAIPSFSQSLFALFYAATPFLHLPSRVVFDNRFTVMDTRLAIVFGLPFLIGCAALFGVNAYFLTIVGDLRSILQSSFFLVSSAVLGIGSLWHMAVAHHTSSRMRDGTYQPLVTHTGYQTP